MNEYKVVSNFLLSREQLENLGFKVVPVINAFYIQKNNKTIAECSTVDGINSFVHALKYSKEK